MAKTKLLVLNNPSAQTLQTVVRQLGGLRRVEPIKVNTLTSLKQLPAHVYENFVIGPRRVIMPQDFLIWFTQTVAVLVCQKRVGVELAFFGEGRQAFGDLFFETEFLKIHFANRQQGW